jgi:hypothetical protein
MKTYRINNEQLQEVITSRQVGITRKIRLVACGGTAMVLMSAKDTTKDIDFMVPDIQEHDYLIRPLQKLGYKKIGRYKWQRHGGVEVDIFCGNKIHTTELLDSPLEENKHTEVAQFARISLSTLNVYDLITSKLFRGSSVDFDDRVALYRVIQQDLDLVQLEKRFIETSSYDISDEKNKTNLYHFLGLIKRTTKDRNNHEL